MTVAIDDADEILGPVAVRPGERYRWQLDRNAKPIRFTIYGKVASKANSRKPAFVGKKDDRRMLFIKSDEARQFEADALKQIPSQFRVRLEGPIRFTATIWYTSELPDLDEALVLDVLQDRWARGALTGANVSKAQGARNGRLLVQAGVYRNDRQVREKHIYHGVDRTNPRVEILIEPLAAQQLGLL